ncbi:MAG: 50S ribosomal protein L21 [Acidimicrobiales bacterium]
MYAVIATGGKQARVAEGDTLDVERLGAEPGADVTFAPILLVDGDTVLSGDELGKATVTGRVLGAVRGPKITGFTYKNKTRSRRRFGHRQNYDRIEITGITKG